MNINKLLILWKIKMSYQIDRIYGLVKDIHDANQPPLFDGLGFNSKETEQAYNIYDGISLLLNAGLNDDQIKKGAIAYANNPDKYNNPDGKRALIDYAQKSGNRPHG